MSKTLNKENKHKILDLLKELCIIEDKENATLTVEITEGGLRFITKETKSTFK